MFALATGDHDRALQAARRAFDLGRRFGVPDLQALGLVFQGYVLARTGEVEEGLLLMDEGMTWALDGRLAPTASAVIFCRTIDTCYELGDYRRASEWMEAIADCLARTGIEAFPGDCEAHSVGILVGRGAWSEASSGRAARVPPWSPWTSPMPVSSSPSSARSGGAEATPPAPRRPSPGPGSWERHHARAWRWSGSPEVTCVGPPPRSRPPCRRRPGTAWLGRGCCPPRWRSPWPTVMWTPHARRRPSSPRSPPATPARRWRPPPSAQARVLLAEGDPAQAATALRRGIALWRQAGAPYETARARLLLGEALEQHGDRRHALAELDAARTAFESLGAKLDLQRVERLLAAP